MQPPLRARTARPSPDERSFSRTSGRACPASETERPACPSRARPHKQRQNRHASAPAPVGPPDWQAPRQAGLPTECPRGKYFRLQTSEQSPPPGKLAKIAADLVFLPWHDLGGKEEHLFPPEKTAANEKSLSKEAGGQGRRRPIRARLRVSSLQLPASAWVVHRAIRRRPLGTITLARRSPPTPSSSGRSRAAGPGSGAPRPDRAWCVGLS